MPACILIINGHPGVGKLTVARELCKLLPNCKILDQHLLIDVADALWERNDPVHLELRQNLRRAVLQSILESITIAKKGRIENPRIQPNHPIFIFPETQGTSPEGRAVLNEYLEFVQKHGYHLTHFVLSCDTETNMVRLTSKGRLEENSKKQKSNGTGIGKLVDEGALLDLRMTEEIGYMFAHQGLRPKEFKGEFEIDTTGRKPKESALLVAEYTMECMRAAGWYLRLVGAA